jgi:signal transduction histidine kinase
LPLRVADDVNGVMSLAFAKPHLFDEHEVRLLELLADQAAIAIHNAQLYQQIQSHAQFLEERVRERTLELQASEEELRIALAREKELNELKTQFVSMVSHDFRTPLTIIQTSTNILESFQERLDERKKAGHFHRINIQIERMVELLNGVLNFSRADIGANALNLAEINLDQFCRSIADEFQSADEMKHRLLYTCLQGSIIVLIDEKLLQQAIINLLTNAFKYSPEGSTVHMDVSSDEGNAKIQVKDSGIGIPKADLPRLFEMFHRAGNVGVIKGTGLGLAIVKRSVEAHGGTIEVESTEGKGTTFKVNLPILTRLLARS